MGLQDGGQDGGPEAHESARDTVLARGRPAESTLSRRATVRKRARDRGGEGEGREEKRGKRGEVHEGGAPTWYGSDRQGASPKRANGQDTSTEKAPRPEHMCSAVVRSCRPEGTTRQEA